MNTDAATGDPSFDLPRLMDALAAQRPIFHSEADSQHALAWEIHEALPEASIRLEYPCLHGDKRFYLDIWVELAGRAYAFELKYGTSKTRLEANGEAFDLRHQSANDRMPYGFVQDIARLERVVEEADSSTIGYAVFLTDCKVFWTSPRPRTKPSQHAKFRIHDGYVLNGRLSWTIEGTELDEGRKRPVDLRGNYPLTWTNYSRSNEGGGYLRYLAVKIEKVK